MSTGNKTVNEYTEGVKGTTFFARLFDIRGTPICNVV